MTMRGVNLDTYNLSLLTAKEDILNPRASTNWALFTYDGVTNNLKLADSGAGGVAELAGKFHASRPMYGLCRLGCAESGGPRVAMICWVGPNVDEYRQTECASHVPAIKNFFKEAHTFVTASNAEDVTEEKLSAAVAKVRPPLQPQRRSSVPVDKEEMVGTNYRKTNAAMEMRRINRDSFWARAEREEEERKEEERKRATEERRRRERERVMQERKEAEERDRKMNEKLQMIEEQRRQQALTEEEMKKKEKSKWDQEQREHEEELRERFRRSESIEKAAEAAALVQQRSNNPREFFRQLSSSSKPPGSPLSPHTGKPPFRRYRRSLTDSAFIFQRSDGGPTSPLSPRDGCPSPFGQSPRRTPTSPQPFSSSGFSQPSRSPLRSPPASPQRSTPPVALLPGTPPARPPPPSTLPPVPAQPQDTPSPSPAPASPGLQASLVQASCSSPASPPGGATAEPLAESPEHSEDLRSAGHTLSSLEPEAGLCVRAVLVEEEEEEEQVEEQEEEEGQTEQAQAPTASATAVNEEEEASTGSAEPELKPELEPELEPAPQPEPEEVQEVLMEEPQPEGAPEAQTEEEDEGVKEEVEEQEAYVVPAQEEEEDSEGPVDAGEEALEQCEDLLLVQSRTLQNGTEKEYMHMTGMDQDGVVEEQGKEISENGDEGSPEQQMCVRALYDYEAEDESELSFAPGDIISDVETVDKGWWRGFSKDGRQGLFPANYVETI
ncbi:drebrin-like protein A [Sardina pilchardus]|uniref:drebrin-like protein A n=1 Tax=Sardina pilchardus TaxID=27697 RepID=UPI002E0DF129